MGGGAAASLPRLLTAICGNSISAQSKWATNYITKGEAQLANVIGGAPMRFPRITATTRTDRHGTYGYSGQTLATINGDLAVQWETPLDAAGVTPEVVLGLALAENDIAQDATSAAIQGYIDTWIAARQAKWPNAKIIICTPRPSFSYDTAGRVAVYQAIRDYILGKDNGRTIFACRLDGYENPSSPGTPLVTNITGSIAGSVLTVTATDGPIGIGTALFGAGVTLASIRSYGTGRGGVGTYNLATSQTVASQTMKVSIHTDDSVHPNAKGALLNARRIAATFARVALAWTTANTILSSNRTLTGSAAATGTNVTGTVPTSTVIAGSANGTYIGTALQPGLRQSVSVATLTGGVGTPHDLSTTLHGSVALSSPSLISPFARVRLVSGAAGMRNLALLPRVQDGGGNTFQNYISDNTGDAEADWVDGDVLTLVSPPLAANSGAISAGNNYLRLTMKLNQDGGVPVVFEVIEQGVEIVA